MRMRDLDRNPLREIIKRRCRCVVVLLVLRVVLEKIIVYVLLLILLHSTFRYIISLGD